MEETNLMLKLWLMTVAEAVSTAEEESEVETTVAEPEAVAV